MTRRKRLILLLAIILGVLLLAVGGIGIWLYRSLRAGEDEVDRQAAYALYQADHARIRADGRHLLRQADPPFTILSPTDPGWSQVPDSIRALQPRSLAREPDCLVITLFGGFIPLDLLVYPDDRQELAENQILLLPGLYYQDERLTDIPGFRRHLEALRAKYPPAKEERP